jgi:hypothetical protein
MQRHKPAKNRRVNQPDFPKGGRYAQLEKKSFIRGCFVRLALVLSAEALSPARVKARRAYQARCICPTLWRGLVAYSRWRVDIVAT